MEKFGTPKERKELADRLRGLRRKRDESKEKNVVSPRDSLVNSEIRAKYEDGILKMGVGISVELEPLFGAVMRARNNLVEAMNKGKAGDKISLLVQRFESRWNECVPMLEHYIKEGFRLEVLDILVSLSGVVCCLELRSNSEEYSETEFLFQLKFESQFANCLKMTESFLNVGSESVAIGSLSMLWCRFADLLGMEGIQKLVVTGEPELLKLTERYSNNFAAALLMLYGSKEASSKARDLLKSHFGAAVYSVIEPKIRPANSSNLNSFARHEFCSLLDHYVFASGSSRGEFLGERLEADINDFVLPLGLDSKKCVRAWLACLKQVDRLSGMTYIGENILMAHDLEQEIKGGPASLARDYNIYDFARYPKSQLLRQLRFENIAQNKYGLLTMPRDDHNQAFYGYVKIIESLAAGLSLGGFELIVVEWESKIGLDRTLGKLKYRFKSHGRKDAVADFEIVCAHGQVDRVSAGSGPEGEISTKDLDDPTFKARVNRFIRPGAPVVFISCDTGKPEGIRDKAEEKLGLPGVAPTEATCLESITPVISPDGGINFRVKYTEGKTAYPMSQRGNPAEAE